MTFNSRMNFMTVLLQEKNKQNTNKRQLLKDNVKAHVLVYFVAVFVALIQGHLHYGTPESKIYSAAGDRLTGH